MALTYSITRTLGDSVIRDVRDNLGDRSKTDPLIRPSDIGHLIIGGGGLFVTAVLALCETVVVPGELFLDGINAIHSRQSKK